jgi:hypothetical protein
MEFANMLRWKDGIRQYASSGKMGFAKVSSDKVFYSEIGIRHRRVAPKR